MIYNTSYSNTLFCTVIREAERGDRVRPFGCREGEIFLCLVNQCKRRNVYASISECEEEFVSKARFMF